MAQSVSTSQGTLFIPGAYSTYTVRADASGTPTSGVIILVGEANNGPDYTLESDLELNAFGPDQSADVVAKYGSGRLVDAFRAASNPANDQNITGAPSRMILVKTNVSGKANAPLVRFDTTTYTTLADKSYGKNGNLINVAVTANTSEILPTTGLFTWIPNVGGVAGTVRVNGGSALAFSASGNATPTTVASTLDGLASVNATGGGARASIPSTGTVALVASGNNITITTSAAMSPVPTAGDTLAIPTGSVIAGGSSANVGGYVVTSATTNTIVATKLSDGGKGGAVAGTVTAPVTVTSTSFSGTPASDAIVYAPIILSVDTGNPIDGIGKTMEVAQASAADTLVSYLFALSTTPVSWLSTTATPKIISSAAEYTAKLSINRQSTNSQETFVAGGDTVLKVGYLGTTALLTINDSTFTITVTGGAGTSLSGSLSDYPTVNDLATFINTKTGYTAVLGSAATGLLPTTALDDVVNAGIATSTATTAGRFKADAYKLFQAVSQGSALVQLQDANGNVVQTASGLPAPSSLAFLSGGAKGGTSAAQFLAAITALEQVRGNFVVPLVSQDATADIALGFTDSSSTYTVDAVNAAIKSHVLAMSTFKKRKARQGFLSKRDTFANVKAAAANIASFRCDMTFMDVKAVGSSGNIVQFQPWYGAVLAAGMQAAGFYRSLVLKGINCSGAVQAAKDFDPKNDSQTEDALKAGLLPIRKAESGAYVWVSDQTTYGTDNNFVFNSTQAVYIADVISTTTAIRMEQAFVGQSLADVSANDALSFMNGIMASYLKLKMIAPSDDAPTGFKNLVVTVNGPAMFVSCEVKLATSLYFVIINFLVSQVVSSAG